MTIDFNVFPSAWDQHNQGKMKRLKTVELIEKCQHAQAALSALLACQVNSRTFSQCQTQVFAIISSAAPALTILRMFYRRAPLQFQDIDMVNHSEVEETGDVMMSIFLLSLKDMLGLYGILEEARLELLGENRNSRILSLTT